MNLKTLKTVALVFLSMTSANQGRASGAVAGEILIEFFYNPVVQSPHSNVLPSIQVTGTDHAWFSRPNQWRYLEYGTPPIGLDRTEVGGRHYFTIEFENVGQRLMFERTLEQLTTEGVEFHLLFGSGQELRARTRMIRGASPHYGQQGTKDIFHIQKMVDVYIKQAVKIHKIQDLHDKLRSGTTAEELGFKKTQRPEPIGCRVIFKI